jgi:DNA-binding beta-propeller fold protein YncE
MRKGLMMAAAMVLAPLGARAELAVAANDGKQLLAGETAHLMPDSVAVLDLAASPVRVVGRVNAPASMIGSPNAVAVARDQSFAIVTAAQKHNPADPLNPVSDDKVSVIDLADPANPKLLQTVKAGPNSAGVTLNRAGTLALVAARDEGAIYAFTVANKKLTPAGKVMLGEETAPADVVFAPDGRHAYAVAWDAGKLFELSVEGARVTRTGRGLVTGRSAYGAVVTPDGRWLISTNVGGTGADQTGSVTVTDLRTLTLASVTRAGKTPEHVLLSPDGRHVAVVLANGAATSRTDPAWNKVVGLFKVYVLENGRLKEVARADTCHWAQGAAWNANGTLLFQQCAAERELIGFRFDGKTLVRDKAITLPFAARPGAIATAHSR